MNFGAMDISATALSAQRLRMDVISSNLANVETTRQPDGSIGAYKRKQVIFAPILNDSMSTGNPSFAGAGVNIPAMASSIPMVGNMPETGGVLQGGVSKSQGLDNKGVQVVGVEEDPNAATKMVYDPSHPDANENGYVEKPNISPVTEMIDMISASRAYEANITAISNYKAMIKTTLQI